MMKAEKRRNESVEKKKADYVRDSSARSDCTGMQAVPHPILGSETETEFPTAGARSQSASLTLGTRVEGKLRDGLEFLTEKPKLRAPWEKA